MQNKDVADAVIGFIEAHPEVHNQLDWRCETGMCFAGWTAEINGEEWWNSIPVTGAYDNPVLASGEHVSVWARKFYDVTDEEADMLFSATNTVDDIKYAVKLISDGESSGYDEFIDTRPSMSSNEEL